MLAGKKKKIPYSDALDVAEFLHFFLSPYCERLESAGELRRKKAEVDLVEFVAIPRFDEDFFYRGENLLWEFLEDWGLPLQLNKNGSPIACGEQHRRFVYPLLKFDGGSSSGLGSQFPLTKAYARAISAEADDCECWRIPISIYTATKDNWGYIHALRTGPDEFNKKWLMYRDEGGCRPREVQFSKEAVYYNGQALNVPTEEDFLAYLGIEYIPPEYRTGKIMDLLIPEYQQFGWPFARIPTSPPLKAPDLHALVLRQPYATLLVVGAKRWVTRGYDTTYRGPVAIIASQHRDADHDAICKKPIFANILKAHHYGCSEALPRGVVLAVGELTEIQQVEKLNKLDPIERMFGDFRDGQKAWKFKKLTPVKKFVSVGEKDGLFQLSEEEARAVRAAL